MIPLLIICSSFFFYLDLNLSHIENWIFINPNSIPINGIPTFFGKPSIRGGNVLFRHF